jgi:hypothetical protein
MNRNTIRFDLSDWLIHFFRKIDLVGSSAIVFPEHMGWGNIYEDTKLSPLFMLRCAIRMGRLWATWAYRNDVRTIYGPSPAVCFTEMPIAAFLESAKLRERYGEAISQFALIFPKKDLFRIGANPVIYGLDDRNARLPSGKDGKARIINSTLLPEREQYRYVTYNPTFPRPIDWTHEREWRWPYRGDISKMERELEEFGLISEASDIPGLDFYSCGISNIGVIVQKEEQAKWVTHDILSLVDRGIIEEKQFNFILVTEKFPSFPDLRDPNEVSRVISECSINIAPYFSYPPDELKGLSECFHKLVVDIEFSAPKPKLGEFGGCWLWILDNTSKLARALLWADRIIISDTGKYLVNLYEFSDDRSLRQREKMTKILAQKVMEIFNVECGYFSVLNSDNPNDLPFYNDDHLDNRMYYNVSWE